MSEQELRVLTALIMCNDDEGGIISVSDRAIARNLANREALRHGYTDWVDAYHSIKEEEL